MASHWLEGPARQWKQAGDVFTREEVELGLEASIYPRALNRGDYFNKFIKRRPVKLEILVHGRYRSYGEVEPVLTATFATYPEAFDFYEHIREKVNVPCVYR